MHFGATGGWCFSRFTPPCYPWETIGSNAVALHCEIIDPQHTPPSSQLVEAGADVNFTDEHGNSVLARAAASATAATVRRLISAGAVDLDRALKQAIENGKHRNCAPLLRAGAAIPAQYHPNYECV